MEEPKDWSSIMKNDDWYRRTTWSSKDAAEFQARLKRSRSDFHKSQYLHIQAGYLRQFGFYQEAIALLLQALRDHPVATETAQIHESLAIIYDALDDVESTLRHFRLCRDVEINFPNVLTGWELRFAEFVVVRHLHCYYDEVLDILDRFEAQERVAFPLQRFEVAAARALISAERGETERVREYLLLVRSAADEKHSGFRYHPQAGLVEDGKSRLTPLLNLLNW